MDPQNQARIKEITEENGGESLVVLLGSAEPDSASIVAETVTLGDPAYAGSLAGVPLGLKVYHILEEEIKFEIKPGVYREHAAILETFLNAAALSAEVSAMRQKGTKF